MMVFPYFKKIIPILTCIVLLSAVVVYAQDPNRLTVGVSYDSASVAEVFNTIPLGFTFISPNGSSTSTRGWQHGRIRWSNLHITTPQGVLQKGQLTFNRRKVWENNHRVTFYIKMKDTTLTCNLSLPYVKRIRFNLYTDSLKRDNPFYLNVEGRFSSGRIYPLDTNMVAFDKYGGGTLRGNILSVTKNDTAVRQVKVEAWLKVDPQIKDNISIPVKIIPDTATLPTEQQLFNNWGKGGREHRQ